MGRPPGSRNNVSIRHEEDIRQLIKRYGDPLEMMLRLWMDWHHEYETQMMRPSRHRDKKKINQAITKMNQYAKTLLPYIKPRFVARKDVHPDFINGNVPRLEGEASNLGKLIQTMKERIDGRSN